MAARVWTETEIRELGVRTDLETAGSILGMGRTKAYDLARNGEFPSPLLRVRGRYVVLVAPLLEVLGYERSHVDPASTLLRAVPDDAQHLNAKDVRRGPPAA